MPEVMLGKQTPFELLPATVTTYTLHSALTVTIDGATTPVKATLGWDTTTLAVGNRVWCIRAGAQLLVIARQNFYG